jgi:hypothetical protein
MTNEYKEVASEQYMAETKKNLFDELHKIAAAVRQYGGYWYRKYEADKEPRQIKNLVVLDNGCIGAAGHDSYYYSINAIFVNEDGIPIVSGCSVGPTLYGSEDPVSLMDEKKYMFPAFMVYDIETDEYICQNEKEMLEEYQRTLEDNDEIAPVACSNARRRIGGKYYGMTWDEYKRAVAESA